MIPQNPKTKVKIIELVHIPPYIILLSKISTVLIDPGIAR